MPTQFTESKIRNGTLTLKIGAGTEFSIACQITSVMVDIAHAEDGDSMEMLDGTTRGGDMSRTDSLKLTGIQDFDASDSFQQWTWDHDGEDAAFVWSTGPTGPTYEGTVTVQAVPVGGEVGKRLSLDVTWPCVGKVTRKVTVPPAGVLK
jgi:hypothetical protein